MTTNTTHYISFEERFKVFIPEEMRVYTSPDTDPDPCVLYKVGLLTKSISYLIDVGLCVLLVPVIYNVYHYFRWGQTIGQKMMGMRVYQSGTYGSLLIGSIPQLITRFIVKLFFALSWAVVGMTLSSLWFSGMTGATIESVDNIGYQLIQFFIMVIWIHGYILPILLTGSARGLHDIVAGTQVLYDHKPNIKRIILSFIFCVCLYYLIIFASGSIMEWTTSQFSPGFIDWYRSIWSSIDYWVVYHIYAFGLAKL